MSYDTHSTTTPYQSRYPELKLPEEGWKSNLPEHLLEGADKQTAWIMNEISKNTQATEFACRGVVEQNNHLRALNGKTFKNERALAEATTEIGTLKAQAAALLPFVRPVKMFFSLWEYRAFRWVIYAGLFFVLTYIYPYYVTHPLDLGAVIARFLGA